MVSKSWCLSGDCGKSPGPCCHSDIIASCWNSILSSLGLGCRIPSTGCDVDALLGWNTFKWTAAVAWQSPHADGLADEQDIVCVLNLCPHVLWSRLNDLFSVWTAVRCCPTLNCQYWHFVCHLQVSICFVSAIVAIASHHSCSVRYFFLTFVEWCFPVLHCRCFSFKSALTEVALIAVETICLWRSHAIELRLQYWRPATFVHREM